MKEVFRNHGIEIVIGMIFAVLATLFYRVIYFSYFNKKQDYFLKVLRCFHCPCITWSLLRYTSCLFCI